MFSILSQKCTYMVGLDLHEGTGGGRWSIDRIEGRETLDGDGGGGGG